MKHGIRFAVVGTLVLGGVVAATTNASATSGSRTITLTVHESTFHYSDAAPAGLSAGDGFQITDRLYQSGKKVGEDAFACTQVSATENICTATLSLPGRGDLQIQGISQTTTDSDLYTVVGGTGQFLGARGTLATSGDSSSPQGGKAVLRLC